MLELIGGPDRDRTGDLFHAMEARSQLRHRPTLRRDGARNSDAVFILSQPRSLVKPDIRLDRTGDLVHAMEARSQLRHRPTLRRDGARNSDAVFILSQPRSLVKPDIR